MFCYCFLLLHFESLFIILLGSLDAEAGIFAMAFDLSGRFVYRTFDFFSFSFFCLMLLCIFSRLLTCEADKTIKIWKENAEATDETHPVDMRAWTKQSLALKRF